MGYKGHLPATHYGTASVHLDRGPGVVYWLIVHPSATSWEIRILDGPDTGAEIIFRAGQAALTCRPYRFNPPLPYERGLYVYAITNITSFTIAYDHLDE